MCRRRPPPRFRPAAHEASSSSGSTAFSSSHSCSSRSIACCVVRSFSSPSANGTARSAPTSSTLVAVSARASGLRAAPLTWAQPRAPSSGSSTALAIRAHQRVELRRPSCRRPALTSHHRISTRAYDPRQPNRLIRLTPDSSIRSSAGKAGACALCEPPPSLRLNFRFSAGKAGACALCEPPPSLRLNFRFSAGKAGACTAGRSPPSLRLMSLPLGPALTEDLPRDHQARWISLVPS